MSSDGPRFIYTPRRLKPYGEGRSWFVRILKITLPLVALGLIGILITRLSGETAQNIADLPKDERTTPGQVELVAAKYEGSDDEGRPYTVTADRAIRAMEAPDTVNFTNPVADITLSDKTWVVVKGKGGAFDHKADVLTMKDDVTVFHDSGYAVSVQDLRIDLKNRTAQSAQPVHAQGPLGMIDAQNMSVTERGDLIVFGGPVTMTIFRLSSKERG